MSTGRAARLFIFDWDGTLINSAGRIVTCLRAAALEIGLPVLADASYSDIIGLGLPQAIDKLYPGLDPVMTARYRDGYAAHFIAADAVPSGFFPGAKEAVQGLRQRGHLVAVATGKSRRGLDRVMANHGVASLFHATRCADETASKPHPRMLLELMAELRVAASQSVMIGDTEYDLEMAARAGMPSVAVTYGVHSRGRLARHGPRCFVHSLADLLAWEAGSGPQDRHAELVEELHQADQG